MFILSQGMFIFFSSAKETDILISDMTHFEEKYFDPDFVKHNLTRTWILGHLAHATCSLAYTPSLILS
jgi:hypothetical protein